MRRVEMIHPKYHFGNRQSPILSLQNETNWTNEQTKKKKNK